MTEALHRPGATYVCDCPRDTVLKNYREQPREIYVFSDELQGPAVIRDNDLMPLAAVVAS